MSEEVQNALNSLLGKLRELEANDLLDEINTVIARENAALDRERDGVDGLSAEKRYRIAVGLLISWMESAVMYRQSQNILKRVVDADTIQVLWADDIEDEPRRLTDFADIDNPSDGMEIEIMDLKDMAEQFFSQTKTDDNPF